MLRHRNQGCFRQDISVRDAEATVSSNANAKSYSIIWHDFVLRRKIDSADVERVYEPPRILHPETTRDASIT